MGSLSALLWVGAALAGEPELSVVLPRGEPAPGAEVPVWIVSGEAGVPVSGLPILVQASAGAIVAQDGEQAPGIWQIRLRAPVGEPTLQLSARAGEARTQVSLTLAPPPAPSLSLPPQLAGAVGQPLTVLVEGADLPPPDRLGVVVSEGRVERVEAADGRLRVTWTPGADPFPRAVLLGVVDRRRPDDVPAWTTLMLRGRPRIPIQTEPGTRATLRLGGRTYGPFQAGADGLAQAVIDVKPGETQVEVSLQDAAGNLRAFTQSLGGSGAPALALATEERLAPSGPAPDLHLRAIDAEGRPWRGAEPVCSTSLGSPGALAPEGAGGWRLALPPLPEDAFFDVRVECTLADQARASARIPVDNALPSRLGLRSWPDELSGDNPVAQVLVTLENTLGERVPGAGVSLSADLGTIEVEETPGQGSLRGLYDGKAAVAQGGDTLRASWWRPPGEGQPWEMVLAAPVGEGPTITVYARALDRRGLPLAEQPVSFGLAGASAEARTDAQGWARVALPRPAGSPVVLEARAASLVRRGVLWAGAALGPDPGAPDLWVERELPIRAGRVREVFLSASPPVLSGGGGETAVVAIRLLDRSGQPVTDVIPHLEATAGELSAPRAMPDGSFQAVFTPPPGMQYGRVNLTASGAQGTPAEFRGTTTLEVVPREVNRAPGLELGALVGGGGAVTPWLALAYNQRITRLKLPVYGRFSLGTYGQHALDADEVTGAALDMDLRLFPLSAGLLTRAEGRRRASWVGLAAVVAPYQLEVRLDDRLIVQGPGISQPGFSLFAGAAWRVRGGELESNLQFLSLFPGDTDVGWQGSVGGVVATLGYKLIY